MDQHTVGCETPEFEDRLISIHAANSSMDYGKWLLRLCGNVADKNVLDIGCGAGYPAIYFSEIGKARVIAVDRNRNLIDKAIDKCFVSGPRPKFIADDVDELEGRYRIEDEAQLKANGLFDIVMCNFAWMYFMDWQGILTWLNKVVSRNGFIMISGYTPSSSHELLELHKKVYGFVPPTDVPGNSSVTDCLVAFSTLGGISVHLLCNKLTFRSVDEFMNYYTATILFQESVKEKVCRMELIRGAVRDVIKKTGRFVISKNVEVVEIVRDAK